MSWYHSNEGENTVSNYNHSHKAPPFSCFNVESSCNYFSLKLYFWTKFCDLPQNTTKFNTYAKNKLLYFTNTFFNTKCRSYFIKLSLCILLEITSTKSLCSTVLRLRSQMRRPSKHIFKSSKWNRFWVCLQLEKLS